MATTTNYSWTTPDDTDLVKDGASAIRTLGSAIDTSFAADQGDLLLGGTSDIFEPLAIGAADTVLTSNGTTASWAAPAGGGKVLQVVQGDYATSTTSSSSTYADTDLTATITPTSATSKILVMYSISARKDTQNSQNAVNFKLLRDATSISIRQSMGYTGTAIQNYFYVASNVLDTPATTSATTYKVQFASDNNTAQVTVQGSNDLSTIILMEIGA
jgi:hypothetical protein